MVACESFWRDVCERRKNRLSEKHAATDFDGVTDLRSPVVGNSEKKYGNIICFGGMPKRWFEVEKYLLYLF